MAKGNLFLGTARGSVGDVTFYRKNGNQISRVRNRKISNPSTQAQLVQRAVIATVAKAYAAGCVIFDHSFEGVSTGEKSQARFMSRNLDLLRSYVEGDLKNYRGDGQCLAAVAARGGSFPVPNGYLVSEGSLIQNYIGQGESSIVFTGTETANQTIAQYCEACGLVDDDIFTVVCFGIEDTGWSEGALHQYDSVWPCSFKFLRFRVKTSAITSTSVAADATLGEIFDIEGSGDASSAAGVGLEDSELSVEMMFSFAAGKLGVIRSRENSGLRSTCYLGSGNPVKWGIISKYLYEAWDPSVNTLGQSPLILEGGGLQTR